MIKPILVAILLLSATCASIRTQVAFHRQGIIHHSLHLYDRNGKPTFMDLSKVWYKDSSVIQEIHRTHEHDSGGVVRRWYTIMHYRYIDLRTRAIYDYKTFSDTARMFHKAALPDTMMRDYGWSFYSETMLNAKGIPESLSDTTIGDVIYKRIKFHFDWDDPQKKFKIGYLKCDDRGNMFSLEKAYCRKVNCTMVKSFDYFYGNAKPFAFKEVNFVSDTLTNEELKVFEAWDKNTLLNPIK